MDYRLSKTKFYILSLSWGLPMTLIGAVVALVLLIAGYKPKKYGYFVYFEVGQNWGGSEFGLFFIGSECMGDYIKSHEAGHGIQNCYYGPLMPFLVCIPSAVRYWMRNMPTIAKKKVFVFVLNLVCLVISIVLICISVTWLTYIAIFFLIYMIMICYWLSFIEIPKYKNGNSPYYDDVWFEGEATYIGTKWKNWYVNIKGGTLES